jgi:hypothetical protein
MARFDWYQATIEEPPLWLRQHLQEGLDGSEWHDAKPVSGYAQAEELVQGGQVVLQLRHGGYHEWPHVQSTGAAADDAAGLIRRIAPRHLVARADVCEDVQEPGWFDKAHGVMLEVARSHRVKHLCEGDWHVDPARTAYLGSPKSMSRIRLYEKGKEVLSKHPEAAGVVPDDWYRLEIQVRPSKREGKLLMSMVPAAEWWGCSSYGRELADRLLGADAPRLKVGTIWKASDLERAEYHMVRQYARVFERLREVHGSWEAVGVHLGRCVQTGPSESHPDALNALVADLNRWMASADD